ncbi:hypothetical protein L3V86_08340, partial [Thiotrichales bacterium 19S11-10]|nr:hypothetical protein [Thiotrichales bacterium 19S11-10]
MTLKLSDLLKKAEDKGLSKPNNTNNNTPKEELVRPWQTESILFNNPPSPENINAQTEDKRSTKGIQTEDKRSTKGIQTEDKRSTKGIQTEDKRSTKGIQTEDKRSTKGIQTEDKRST